MLMLVFVLEHNGIQTIRQWLLLVDGKDLSRFGSDGLLVDAE